MTLRVRLVAPTGEAVREFTVSTFPARIGRDTTAAISVDEQRFPVVSGLHAEIDRTPAGLVLTAKSLKNRTLHNDRPVDGPVLIQAGDRIRLGVTGPTVLILAIETIELFGGHRAAVGESEAVAVSRRRWRARSAALLAAGLILLVAGVLLCLVLRTCSTR